jgi:putative acetyltransferase
MYWNEDENSRICKHMNIVPHYTSPFTSQLLFLMFKKAVMNVSDRDYSLSQRRAWCSNICQIKWHERLRHQHTFLTYFNQNLCGFITVASNGYIDLLYIDPELQRKGVGSALLSYADRFATENAISKLSINASVQSRNLCEKYGFTHLEQFVRLKDNEKLKSYRMVKKVV